MKAEDKSKNTEQYGNDLNQALCSMVQKNNECNRMRKHESFAMEKEKYKLKIDAEGHKHFLIYETSTHVP